MDYLCSSGLYPDSNQIVPEHSIKIFTILSYILGGYLAHFASVGIAMQN